MFKKLFTILSIVLFSLIFSFNADAQCAMCRATVGSNLSEGRGVIGTGLNFGILYMLVTPYILVSVIAFLWFRNGKKELKKRKDLSDKLRSIYSS